MRGLHCQKNARCSRVSYKSEKNHILLFLKKKIYFYFVCMGVLPCMYVCAPRALPMEEQKRASDPLELKLQAVVSHHVGAWNGTQALSSGRAASAL